MTFTTRTGEDGENVRLTKETEHALEALVHLGRQKTGAILEAGVLADEIGVPRPFMSKILQRLSKAQFVSGHRGNPRGYSLAVAPSRLNVRSVIEAMEGDDIFHRCIFWSEECSETNACPLHGVWKNVRPIVRAKMTGTTVADLAARK